MEEDLFYKFLGEKIRKVREEKGITLIELSQKTNLRKEYLQKLENGEVKRLSMVKFWQIAEGLNVPSWYLLKGYENIRDND